ncbi:MAG TPA: hypothetical protein VIK91_11735, partial [Nannocystis sp.]
MSDTRKKPKEDDRNPLRSVGSALGGWARRMGTILSEVTQSGPPEEVARAIAQARESALAGDYAAAVLRLRDPLVQRPGDPHLRLALALTRVAQVLTDGAHLSVLHELAEPQGKRGERGLPETLAEAARLLLRDEFDPALDQLRRARKLVEDAAEPAIHDARFLVNLLTTLLQIRRGRFERGLLEFQRARARLPEGTRGPLRALLIREGAQLLLAEDHLDEAIAWLTGEADLGNPAVDTDPAVAAARAHLAVALAAKGDRLGVDAVRAKIPALPEWDEHRIRIHLCLGTGAEARELALRHLQLNPQDPRRKRLWALCEIAGWPVGTCDAPDPTRKSVVDALVDAASDVAGERLERHLHELAHVALRADYLSEGAVALIRRRLQEDPASAPEELRLV